MGENHVVSLLICRIWRTTDKIQTDNKMILPMEPGGGNLQQTEQIGQIRTTKL